MQQFEVDLETQQEREPHQMVYFYEKNLVFFLSLCRSLRNLLALSHINDDSSKVLLVNNDPRLPNLYHLVCPYVEILEFNIIRMHVGHRELQFRPDLRNLFS